jgi:hypothetical protein
MEPVVRFPLPGPNVYFIPYFAYSSATSGLMAFALAIDVAAGGVAFSHFGDAATIEPICVVGDFRQRERRVVVGKRLVELPEL